MEKQSRVLLSQNGELSSYLKESIDGVQTVKAFQAESYVKQRMKELFVRLQEEGIRFSMMGLRKNTIIELFTSVGILALLWAGACSVIDGSMSAGSLITFYTLLAYFLSPVENLAGLQAEIQEAVIAADRLNDILDAALEETHPENENSLQNGNVEIDRVSFRYGNRQLTLKDLSLRIENGQHAALVGGSGCGKTSVFKLLMGFSRAESGTIGMGDVDMDDLSISCLRSGIAYVPQEIFLFSATIRDNLLLGDIKADDDRLKAVLDACGCDFVKTLPMELDTMLEENGENLSGGQRQRLAIARAMLRDPRILILDEATSSLDSLSERRILDAIYKLNPEMTVLMSAHRLNTVRQCDKIFVMDKGCVIQSGTHDDLVLSPGLYRQMGESQNG
jgi:ATP-binding cassette subfamily B protein